MSKPKPKYQPPKPIDVTLKPRNYQPSKAELEETMDMPGMTEKQIRDTFMRPIRVTEKA